MWTTTVVASNLNDMNILVYLHNAMIHSVNFGISCWTLRSCGGQFLRISSYLSHVLYNDYLLCCWKSRMFVFNLATCFGGLNCCMNLSFKSFHFVIDPCVNNFNHLLVASLNVIDTFLSFTTCLLIPKCWNNQWSLQMHWYVGRHLLCLFLIKECSEACWGITLLAWNLFFPGLSIAQGLVWLLPWYEFGILPLSSLLYHPCSLLCFWIKNRGCKLRIFRSLFFHSRKSFSGSLNGGTDSSEDFLVINLWNKKNHVKTNRKWKLETAKQRNRAAVGYLLRRGNFKFRKY